MCSVIADNISGELCGQCFSESVLLSVFIFCLDGEGMEGLIECTSSSRER